MEPVSTITKSVNRKLKSRKREKEREREREREREKEKERERKRERERERLYISLSLSLSLFISLSLCVCVCVCEFIYSGCSVHQRSRKPGFNPRSRHTKGIKMVLGDSMLNIQYYKVKIKGN